MEGSEKAAGEILRLLASLWMDDGLTHAEEDVRVKEGPEDAKRIEHSQNGGHAPRLLPLLNCCFDVDGGYEED